jgi:hypothetical protein
VLHFFVHEGISLKSLRASEQDQADVAWRRAQRRSIKDGLSRRVWPSSIDERARA